MPAKRSPRGHFKPEKIYPLIPGSPHARKNIPLALLKTIGVKFDKKQIQALIPAMLDFLASEDTHLEMTGCRKSGFLRLSSRRETPKPRKAEENLTARKEVPVVDVVRKTTRRPRARADLLSEQDKYYLREEQGDKNKKRHIDTQDLLIEHLSRSQELRGLGLRRRQDIAKMGRGTVLSSRDLDFSVIVEATLDDKWPAANKWPIGWDNAPMSIPERKAWVCNRLSNCLFVKVNESLTRAALASANALNDTPSIWYRNDHDHVFNQNRFHWLKDESLITYCTVVDLPREIAKAWQPDQEGVRYG